MIFYQLKLTAFQASYATFDVVGDAQFGEAPSCPHCGEELGGRRWLPPHHVRFRRAPVGDFATDGSDMLVSRNFKDAFNSSSMRGLEFFPEEVACNIDQSYFVAFPVHTLTWIDEDKSQIDVYKRFGCEKCRILQRRQTKRIRLVQDTWGGEDVFFPSGLFGILLATERFVQFVSNNGFTNFVFVHEDEFVEHRHY